MPTAMVSIAALRAEIDSAEAPRRRKPPARPAPRRCQRRVARSTTRRRASIIADVKRQLQDEMGLLPLNLLRDRSESFVELYSYDDRGSSSYGTAGYLGDGYFITVKHGVVALEPGRQADPRKIISVKVMYKGKLARRAGRRLGRRERRGRSGRLGDHQGQGEDRPAAAERQPGVRLRLRRSDLPARQRLLEGHHPVDRLRRPADVEQAGDVPHRRPSRRVGRRRAEPRRRAGRHSDRPDAGRLSLLVHPAAAAGDVPESPH